MSDFQLDEAGVARLWERFRRDHGDIPSELDGVVAAEARDALVGLVNDGHNVEAYIAERSGDFLSGIADRCREKMTSLGMRPDLTKQPGFFRDLVEWRKKNGFSD